MKVNEKFVDELEMCVNKATQAWTTLDWKVDEGVDIDELTKEVEMSAAIAAQYGKDAVDAAANGDIDSVMKLLLEARLTEEYWGGDFTWGPVYEFAKLAVDRGNWYEHEPQ